MATEELFAELAERLSRTSAPTETDHRKFWSGFYNVDAMEDAAIVEANVVKVITRHTLPELLIHQRANTPVFNDVWNRALFDAGLSLQAKEQLFAAWGDILVVETAGMNQAERKTWFTRLPRYSTYTQIRKLFPDCSYGTVGSFWRVMRHLFNDTLADNVLVQKTGGDAPDPNIVAAYYRFAKAQPGPNLVAKLLASLRTKYPDLADLPDDFLVDIASTQPFPADWYRNTMLMPDELLWVDPNRTVKENS